MSNTFNAVATFTTIRTAAVLLLLAITLALTACGGGGGAGGGGHVRPYQLAAARGPKTLLRAPSALRG